MLHELLYVSVETRRHTKDDLLALLNQSRANNEKLGITGILLYYKKHFLQVLEGEKETIFELLRKIRKDARHASVIMFWDQPIEKRNFQDWTMAFVNLEEIDRTKLKGFSDFLDKGFDEINDNNLTIAQKLLLACKKLL
jgi:hypothetical protein